MVSGDWPHTEATALKTWTPLTATATAAWPDMRACTAVGPKSEAITIMAVWRYAPRAAWETPLSKTKAKNIPGLVWMKVLRVSRNVRADRQRVVIRIRREGED